MARAGAYLRTNYRTTGLELDINAIGEGFLKGSWAGGSGIEGRQWGGLVMYSVNASTMGSGADKTSVAESCDFMSMTDVMASYWGANVWGGGFKMVPVWVGLRYAKTSMANIGGAGGWASASDSLIMVMVGGSGESAVASTQSARYVVVGFICSGPNVR